NAAAGGDDDSSQLFDIHQAAAGAHHDAFAVALDVARAPADVVGINRPGDIREGKAKREQFRSVRIDLVLLEIAADRVHAGNTRHHLDLRLDDPVLDSPQIRVLLDLAFEHLPFHREEAAVALHPRHAVALGQPLRKVRGPHVDFAEASRNRTDAGLDALRQASPDLGQAFADLLAREIDV